MTQTTEERIAALESLLPLLEAHIEVRTTTRALWVSPPETHPPGYVPPPPEPDCDGECSACVDFKTKHCGLREERWAQTWERLRKAYPQLLHLEALMPELMYQHADWASALYWVYVQPWREWHQDRRSQWAAEGVAWLAKEWGDRELGWVPTYEPERVKTKPKGRGYDLDAEVQRLREGKATYTQIARELNCSYRDVSRAAKAPIGGTEA